MNNTMTFSNGITLTKEQISLMLQSEQSVYLMMDDLIAGHDLEQGWKVIARTKQGLDFYSVTVTYNDGYVHCIMSKSVVQNTILKRFNHTNEKSSTHQSTMI